MKIYEILNEDGRIVKGVNTTVDVGPNEIKTQAAKFGNTVDKDGVPPTLSKKVKGKSTNVLFNLGLAEDTDVEEAKQRLDPKCWKGYRKDGTKMKDGKRVNNCVKVSEDEYTWEGDLDMLYDDEILDEAEYQGRKVKLGKPMQGDVKKFKVYVKNPKGNVVKVNFGDPDMKIKKSNPARRRSFRARHNCDNPGPRHKARYWSCRKW